MFELRDKIRELDVATDMKFDLLGLYEMSELTDAEKKLMATIIYNAENEEKAAEEVFEILNAPNAVNMDEDCEPERKLKEVFHPAYEELQNGDEIIVNGQHLYVADAEYADDYVWVTDEKEDRYNKRAPGNTLAKYMIDDVIGQPDDDDDEELDEAQDIYDIQGQAVRDARRKEVLDEFKEIFTDEPGGINLDNKETLAIVRGYLEDMGYIVEVSETQNASHPIHIEWFK